MLEGYWLDYVESGHLYTDYLLNSIFMKHDFESIRSSVGKVQVKQDGSGETRSEVSRMVSSCAKDLTSYLRLGNDTDSKKGSDFLVALCLHYLSKIVTEREITADTFLGAKVYDALGQQRKNFFVGSLQFPKTYDGSNSHILANLEEMWDLVPAETQQKLKDLKQLDTPIGGWPTSGGRGRLLTHLCKYQEFLLSEYPDTRIRQKDHNAELNKKIEWTCTHPVLTTWNEDEKFWVMYNSNSKDYGFFGDVKRKESPDPNGLGLKSLGVQWGCPYGGHTGLAKCPEAFTMLRARDTSGMNDVSDFQGLEQVSVKK